MGWTRYLLLGDLGQHLDISKLREDVESIRRELLRERSSAAPTAAADARQDLAIRRLERENDELRLCISVLTRAMVRKGVLTTDEAKVLTETLDSEPPGGLGDMAPRVTPRPTGE